MTIKKSHIVEYVALINLQFPSAYQFVTEKDSELFVNLWYDGLKSYPEEICDIAVRNAILKSEFAPKIATVLKEVESLISSCECSDGVLWGELVFALGRIRGELPYACDRYDTVIHDDTGLTSAGEARRLISDTYNGLDAKIKEYCGSVRGFMELAQIDETELHFEKGRFLKQLPILAERAKVKRSIPPQLANLVEGLIENNERKMIGENKWNDKY